MHTMAHVCKFGNREEAVTSDLQTLGLRGTRAAIRGLVERYGQNQARRASHLDKYRDNWGDVKEGEHGKYDDQRIGNALEAQLDLDALLNVLARLAGPRLKEGDVVTVSEAATTACGGGVYFLEALTAIVVEEEDLDGDVNVQDEHGVTQWVDAAQVRLVDTSV